MDTASLRQNITPRYDRQKPTRFRLIVNGKTRGIWEKKARVTKPVREPKKTSLVAALTALGEDLKSLRLILVIGTGVVLLLVAVAAVAAVAAPSMTPLSLPVTTSALQDAFEAATAPIIPAGSRGTAEFRNLETRTYTVRQGQTLSDIAKTTKLDLDTIISFNSITNAYAVRAGTTLRLPNNKGLVHVVRKGDTLQKISNRYSISFDELLDWNNLSSSVIGVGQKLFIPGGKLSANEVNKVLGKLFVWPTRGEISSYFGMRISPITGSKMFHGAIDITNRPLTPIVAAMAGWVATVGYNETYGNYISIVHADGFQTFYAHCERIYVKRGQTVGQGATIAGMGTTGASTGYHLHFAVYKNGKEVDPLKYLN